MEREFVVRGYVKVKAASYENAIFLAILTFPKFNITEGITK